MSNEPVIRVAIVDDEEPSRDELRYLLEQIPGITIVLEAESSMELLNNIERIQPHIIFLDIEMPKDNGLKLAQTIYDKKLSIFIIFATAHEEFALKAFELNAIDYILKPFSLKRVMQCIERMRTLLQSSLDVHKPEVESIRKQFNRNKLALEYNGKTIIINVDDIIIACCEEGQLLIYTKNKIYNSSMALNELQMRLDTRFFRSHRGYLVNTEKITEVIPWFNGTLNLVMDGINTFEVPVSRQQATKLKKIFGL